MKWKHRWFSKDWWLTDNGQVRGYVGWSDFGLWVPVTWGKDGNKVSHEIRFLDRKEAMAFVEEKVKCE